MNAAWRVQGGPANPPGCVQEAWAGPPTQPLKRAKVGFNRPGAAFCLHSGAAPALPGLRYSRNETDSLRLEEPDPALSSRPPPPP